MKAKLTEDIRSSTKKIVYGIKGEIVSVVSDFHNVVIVQNASGNKYPVHRTKVQILSAI